MIAHATHRRARLLPCVALWLVVGCSKPAPEEVESAAVVTVKTAGAVRGDIAGFIRATGVVTPAPGADLVVVAPEPARIAAVPKAVGESVRRGDVLVRFEIPASAAEAERQQAEVARANASLETAKAAQTRARELFERGVAARKEVEDADRAVADASAALAQAQASLKAAQTMAARATVRASFEGVVAQRQHNAGDLVEASASDPVIRVIDPRRLEVVASVPLADAPRIRLGAAARLVGRSDTGSADTLKVRSQPVAVEAGTATIPVRLGFAGRTLLPAGTPVQVEIAAEWHTNVVLVPAAAIVREGEDTFVFVASDGKAQRRPVDIGLRDDTRVEILSGVKAGEQVVVEGQAGLPDGAAITVAEDKAVRRPVRTGSPAAENEGT
jgi:RND family efflux transporter MFP subunit